MTSPSFDAPADAPEGLVLLGAEMLAWSDYASSLSAADGGAARDLVRRAATGAGRVLFLGPHDATLVQQVAGVAASTEVVLRSLGDAEQLRAQVDGAVTVSVGAFDAFTGTDYDLVVALDGLDRLLSAEEPPLAWDRLLDKVLSLPGAAGRILLALGNEAGLDRLLSAAPTDLDDDAHWPGGRVVDDVVPLGFAELTDALARRDGWAFTARACFGRRSSPTVVAPAYVVDALRHDPRFGALLDRAAWETSGSAAPVHEPSRLARTMLRHGQGVDAAPIWLFDGQRGAAPQRPDEVLWLDRHTGGPSLLAGIDVSAPVWRRTLLEAVPDSHVGLGVERHPAALEGEIPAGRLVFEQLAEAVGVQDLDTVGQLVRGYRDWLAAGATTTGADEEAVLLVDPEKAPVTLDNLLDTEAGLVVFDPSLRALDAAPLEQVLLRTLFVAADDLVRLGRRSPWPAGYDARHIAVALANAAGLTVDEAAWPQIEELDTRLQVGRAIGSLSQLATAEAMATVERYRTALDQAEAQLEWLVLNIHYRQRAVLRAQARARKLAESPQYRAGQRVLWIREKTQRAKDKWRARNAAPPAPVGEWRAPQEGAPVERDPVEVDPSLLPPGYETKGPII